MNYEEELKLLVDQWEADYERLRVAPDDNPRMDESSSIELRRLIYQFTKSVRELKQRYGKL